MDSPHMVYDDIADISQDLDQLYERLRVVVQTTQASELIEENFQADQVNVGSKVIEPLNCRCKDVFSGTNPRVCNICGESIKIVNQLLKAKLNFEEQIESLEDLVKAEREDKAKLSLQNQRLEEKLAALEIELDERHHKVQALEKVLNDINTNYSNALEKLSKVQHSKDLADEELAELSRKLFEEANKMVAEEAQARRLVELGKERLEDEVMQLRNQLFVQTNLNRILKRKLKFSLFNSESQNRLTDPEQAHTDDSDGDVINFTSFSENEENLDEFQLEQFEVFAASCVNSPLNKVLHLPFFKRCFEEDIEPCLKFGPNPRIYPRRIIDAIIHNTLRVFSAGPNEASPRSSFESLAEPSSLPVDQTGSSSALPAHSHIVAGMWDRWSSAAAQAISSANRFSQPLPANGCHACGQEVSCQFRLQLVERQEPMPIDKFCRDRIISCVDFFSFLEALRTGQYNARRIDDLYTESLRLRLRMFYARLGFLPSSGIEIPRPLEYLALPATHLAPVLKEVENSESSNPGLHP